MDFSLTPSQTQCVRDAVDAVTRLGPLPDVQTPEFWQTVGQAGWLNLCISSTHGGAGQDALTAVLVHEALGRHGVSRSALFSMGAHLFGTAMTLEKFADPTMAKHWIPGLATGKAIGALGLTEPSGGSDLADLQTSATAQDDGWTLNGTKTYVTNGHFADVILISARHPEIKSTAFSTSVFAIPRAAKGVETTPITGPIGLLGSPMATISLSDVKVGSQNLLGKRGQGLAVILTAMRTERACILAGFLGAAERDLQAALSFFEERRQKRHQAVNLALAEMHAKLESARWTLYRGAWGIDHGGDPVKDPAVTKTIVSRILVDVARDLQELAAGAGWRDEMGLATAVADTMGILTASGTTTTQLRAIATRLGR